MTRASSSSPASGTHARAGSEKTRSVGGVGTVVSRRRRRRRVAPVHASAAPATRTSEDHDDEDAFSSHGDGDTIVAIATPVVPQAGGVAIIRLSGPSAVSAAMSVFRPASRAAREDAREHRPPRSHLALYGVIVDPATVPGDDLNVNDEDVDADELDVIDEVLLLPMLAPRSYTAEDVVEIHCHGGSVCVQRVLSLLTRRDATHADDVRLARPGEFTLRAFLNGRLDLTQAEAVQSLVSARTERAADGALAALRGGLVTPVRDARGRCVDVLAELEARLDFEDEMEPLDVDGLIAEIRDVRHTVASVLSTARRGRLLHTGVSVAIVGRPNAGKSSLLNAWSRSERAIVTPVAGTTRDVVEASVEVGGLPVTLLDTAGIRGETSDEVEAIGVERSRAAAAGADAVVMVVDATEGWTADDDDIWRSVSQGMNRDEDLDSDDSSVSVGDDDDGKDEWANAKARLHKVRGTRHGAVAGDSYSNGDSYSSLELEPRADKGAHTAVLVVNKTDALDPSVKGNLASIHIPSAVCGQFGAVVYMSARTKDGLEDLERAIGKIVEGGDVDAEGAAWSANQRQAEALEQALGALERLESTVSDGTLPVDFWTIDLREAAMALGAVTGDDVGEDVLDVIFTKFCIGK